MISLNIVAYYNMFCTYLVIDRSNAIIISVKYRSTLNMS